MPQPLDTRDYSYKRPALAAQPEREHPRVAFSEPNPMTGMPGVMTAMVDATGPGTMVDRALGFMKDAGSAFATSDQQAAEFLADPDVMKTSSGGAAVHLMQHYHGVPVFEMTRTVRFAVDGTLEDAVGNDCMLPPLDLSPVVSVRQAAVIAAQHAAADHASEVADAWGQTSTAPALDVSGYAPEVLASFMLPSRPTVLDKGPFGDVTPAQLVIFYQGARARLAWRFSFTWPDHACQYAILVSADAPLAEVLYCQETSWSARAEGTVFERSPGRAERARVPFPLPAERYPIKSPPRPLPEGFPFDWVKEGETAGNCTIAVLGSTQQPLQCAPGPAGPAFAPADGGDDDQKVLNIFYFCNYMHDFFYMLGFDEEAGNFQEINASGLGAGGDAVLAMAHSGPVAGTANMLTRADGMRAMMNMGLVASTKRHTAFDADVVFHEFTHGVTTRLVGGRLNDQSLQQPQSRGMGEGWSDYFAVTIQNHGQEVERVTVGDWVIGRPGGIRKFPYDESFPDHFGKLGAGRYQEPHNVGEIWSATLVQLNRELGKALGDRAQGHELGWQIVVDGLKLTPANPSFLDARDAILRALDEMGTRPQSPLAPEVYRAAKKAAWSAFARFGLGPAARSDLASLFGAVADFTLPPGL